MAASSALSTQHSALHPLAFDLGAESGRAVRGAFDGARLTMDEIYRFPNEPVRVPDGLYWDALRLFHEMQIGLRKAGQEPGSITSVGVDTWGVDFALLDRDGALLGNPVHYRDGRRAAIFDAAFATVSAEEMYATTGIQFIPINTLYQLLAIRGSAFLDDTNRFLMMPDLFHYWLSGVQANEYTDASTTQLLDVHGRRWAGELIRRFDLPLGIFQNIIAPGTPLGSLRGAVAEEAGIPAVPMIVPATHDTASAVAAIPFASERAAYVSCGTWALVGVEMPEPVVTAAARAANLTNEGGVDGTIRLLKNITGLWLVQECQRAWARAGEQADYATLTSRALDAPPFGPLIDPDAPAFVAPGDMPARIAAYCTRTGQTPPQDTGEMVRCTLESLALAWHSALEQIAGVVGHGFDVVHVVGGGSRNALLCQLVADAMGLPVIAGPAEATALGNLLMQLRAQGELASLAEMRALVRHSEPLTTYDPHPAAQWDEAYNRFKAIQAKTGGGGL
jgi:rhamnulokinase